ncbi:hypothetical protein B0H14DRAFT_3528986 [Mycena olivaceomarginata]|nr:hypothetical protein B0H14DRAFT_3528986 [Mycena olivaceomarginata]
MSLDLRERSSRRPASTLSTMKPKSRAMAKFRGSPSRIHLHSLIPRADTNWFNGIAPDFYDSHLAVIAVRTAHSHNAVYPKATVPEDLQLVSDLLDEPPIGGCFVNTIASAPVGRNFAAFAAGLGSFLLHRLRRHLGQLTSQPCTPARSPLPVPKIHGGSDTDVPYAGGRGRAGRSLPFLIVALCDS